MKKTISCKACNLEISGNIKFCPSCGHKNKKPIYKQWWLYVSAAIVVTVIAVSSSDTDNTSGESVNQSKAQTSNLSEKNSPVSIFKLLEDNEVVPYTLTAKAETFLTEHQELFPSENTDKISEFIDYELETKYINKNPDNYGDKLMHLPYLYVNQIYETEIDSSLYLTELNVADQDVNQYYVFYIGKLNTIFEGDEIELYGLPLNTSSFDNTDGGKTLVIVLAGTVVTKIAD